MAALRPRALRPDLPLRPSREYFAGRTLALIVVDELSFEQLVNAHYESLYRFALSLTQREADAGDLTQQTFYLWATKGHQLRDRTRVKSWLFTTLHREFLGSRRRETRFPHVEIDHAGPDLPSVSPAMVNQIDGATVMETLVQVEELYRAPLMLFYLQEHSYQEIADILGVPIGTVMSRLARGKEQLRKRLAVRSARADAKAADKIVPLPAHKMEQRSNG
jgi:RNA polymerase sigma-70 factor (ECF subfamily)